MKAYFLDTSIIIDYLRGKEMSVKMVDDLDGPLTSGFICLAELFEGVYNSKNIEQAQSVVIGFFNGLSRIYSIDIEVAEKFGALRKELKERGKVIEDIDILIASLCLVNSLTIVTLNVKHFSRIEGLKIADIKIAPISKKHGQ